MRSIFKKKKTIVILGILLTLFLNVFTISNGLATVIQEDAVFDLDKEDPLGPQGYGAIIPSPNTLGTVYIDGSNQGKFTIMDWDGSSTGYEEIVSFPGEDISLYYPMTLDDYWVGSLSYNDEINPWTQVRWLNVSAYNAEAEDLSPFTVSTLFDYYALVEGGTLNAPANDEQPMQIDVIIKSGGPKVLKFDWIMANPAAASYDYYLISPSGRFMDANCYPVPVSHSTTPGTTLFNYLIFTAHQAGTYRLIFEVYHTAPSSLYLEFLHTQISSLPINSLQFGGNSDGILSIDLGEYANWQSKWFRISGKKGDLFTLDLFEDYSTGFTPIIDIWTPCANGYFLDISVGTGTHEIYFPKNGYAYVSFTDMIFGDWYRYSLFLKKIETVQYNLGDSLTSYMISGDESTAIQFSLREDSIVRFNYTSLSPGNPEIYAFGSARDFIYMNSKELYCYDINSDFFTSSADSTDFYWHFMPAGTYKAVIENTVPLSDGIFKISSQVYEWSDMPIPVNTLTYPIDYPSEFLTLDFEADPDFESLKSPVGIDIIIPNMAQVRLNTTMWAVDNIWAAASSFPSHLYTLNDTDLIFYTSDYPYPAFSTDGLDSEVNDYLYIGAPTRWTGMTFDFSVPGVAGSIDTPLVYTDPAWGSIPMDNDGTSGFTADGTIELDISNANFAAWTKGADDDLDPNITESNYYWMAIRCSGDYSTVPIIQELTLLNNTIRGDLQFVLIRESGYKYDDYWAPSQIIQPTDLLNLEVSLDDDDGGHTFDTRESYIIENLASDPYTIGLEGGTYKLLIVPEQWDCPGTVSVQFAVEDFWGYAHHETYDIVETPHLHSRDITNYTFTGYSNITGSIYPYGLTTWFNHTESLSPYGGESYFALECSGKPYQWTQLVVTADGLGIGDYDLYLIQDLPWINANGPNNEIEQIFPTNVDYNTTYEFGVFSDHFTLLFEVSAPAGNNVSFYISLSQYDTIPLITSDLRASYTPPLDPALIIALAIGIPAAAGAVVVVYVLKKKGKILTKRPS
ncbi:MAG: hypothetical protein ACFE9Q_09050 [Candidatus Hodarchaeota archaeon]